MSDFDVEVGRRIRDHRKVKGMAQGELASAVGFSQPAQSFFENGARHVRLEELLKYAKVLGVPLTDLYPNEVSDETE